MKTSMSLMKKIGLDQSCASRLMMKQMNLEKSSAGHFKSEEFEIIDLIGKADTNDIVQYLVALGETATVLRFALHCVDISFQLVKKEVRSHKDDSVIPYESAIYSMNKIIRSIKNLFEINSLSKQLMSQTDFIARSDKKFDAFNAVNAAVNLCRAMGSTFTVNPVDISWAQKSISDAVYAVSESEDGISLMRQIEKHLQDAMRYIDGA